MSPQLHWIAAPPASLAHAAAMHALGHTLVDADLAARLAPIVAATEADLLREQVDRQQFWANLVPWSANLSPAPPAPLASQLLDQLSDCDWAITDDELLLRAGPLRAAWEARGPGIWKSLDRIARHESASPQTTSVVLLRPALGGGGAVFPTHNAISLEAMLANPHRELPEIVRLGWLLAQVRLTSSIADPHRAALALIPLLLTAAEEVELARCDRPTIALAVRAWQLADDDAAGDALATKIDAWWRTQQIPLINLRDAVASFD